MNNHFNFHRIPIDGKRRIMVWSSDLHRMLGIHHPKHRDWLSSLLLRTGLRDGMDYQYGRDNETGEPGTHLSISAVQAILVVINSDQSWKLHNQLSDLINRGFSNEPSNEASDSNRHRAVPTQPFDPSSALSTRPYGINNRPHRGRR